MLLVGFFVVRKLIENRKITDACARMSVPIARAKIQRDRVVSDFDRHALWDDLEAASGWTHSKTDIQQLADKVVHAWWLAPMSTETGGLDGYVFTTDRYKNTELWMLSSEDIAKVFERFSVSAIGKLSMKRDEKGGLTYWKAE